MIKQTTIKTNSLEELFQEYEENTLSPYSVAWIDLKKRKTINSLLFLGEHVQVGKLFSSNKKQKYIPIKFFSMFLNKYFINLFNNIYYSKNFKKKDI